MSKKLEDEKLPASYTNLGFDAERVAGPSAPADIEVDLNYPGPEPGVGPSAPKEEEAGEYVDSQKPPSAPSAPIFPPTPPPPYFSYSAPSLLFEDVFEACMNYVRDHCCYSSRFVRQMKLTSIDNQCAFHYTLESYGEKRESTTRHCPYKGGPIDGPENGPPPGPWDMFVPMHVLFQDSNAERDIPHTEFVETCWKCSGSGKTTCSWCSGSGRSSCSSCSGSGRDSEDRTCSSCSGSGNETCFTCGGSGKVTCSKCDGYGKLKGRKVLIVTWTNHKVDFLTEIYQVPADRIRKAQGDTLVMEEEEKLLPIVNAPESVNMASARMIQTHNTAFRAEVIRRQRHHLRGLPFTRVQYEWKETTGEFYVYGKEKAVYFEEYPQQCCCCPCC